MGINYCASFHLFPATGLAQCRAPTALDMGICDSIMKDYGFEKENSASVSDAPKMQDVGKFYWGEMANKISKELPPGLAFVVYHTNDSSPAVRVDYYLAGVGFAYSGIPHVPMFNADTYNKISSKKLSEEERLAKIKKSAEKKLAKLTPEERKAVGLK